MKEIFFIFIICASLLLFVDCQLAPEDKPIVSVLSALGEHPNILKKHFRLERKQVDHDGTDRRNYQTAACDGCLGLVDLINDAIDSNENYSTVRNETVQTCIDLLWIAGYNKSHIMCPGIMDQYVPHLLYILKTKRMTSREVCYRMNFCESPTPEPPHNRNVPHAVLKAKPSKKHKSTRKPRRRRKTSRATFKVAQINDVHIDPEYEVGAPTDCGLLICCRKKYTGTGQARQIGEYSCNTHNRTIAAFLDKIEEINPDFILYAGDNPPHSLWEETKAQQHGDTRQVIDMIAQRISSKKTYPGIGNHEAYPTNLYYVQRPEVKELNDMLVEKWPMIAPLTSEQITTIRKAAYYSITVKPGLRLLSYNTNYGYVANFYFLLNQAEQPYADMKQFMEETLNQAQTNNEKVIMLGHHPLGGWDSEIQHAQWMTDIVLRFKDIIVLHVHGHTHRDHFKLYVDANDGVAKSLSLVAPSMTTFTNHNPAFRVYTLDSQTFQLLDYDQYYIQINHENITGIEMAYSAKTEYQLPDMSPNAWQNLSERMETDNNLLLKYRRNTYTKSGKEGICDTDECKYQTICSTRHTIFSGYRECVKPYIPSTTQPPANSQAPVEK